VQECANKGFKECEPQWGTKKATTACTYCAVICKKACVPPKSWIVQVERVRVEMDCAGWRTSPAEAEMAQRRSNSLMRTLLIFPKHWLLQ
jgi:hypothetical protein